MNLASQAVLEGLNSCFDFRKSLHICELNKTFHIEEEEGCSRRCRFFACQNPQSQGGDRRVLPKSFLNRFTPVGRPSPGAHGMSGPHSRRFAQLRSSWKS